MSKTRLYFWQPVVQVSAPLAVGNKKKALEIKASSHCRALLNRSLWERLATGLTQLQKSAPKPSLTWVGSPSMIMRRTAKDTVTWKEKAVPAKIGIALGALRPYKKVKDGYSSWTNWVPDSKPISLQTYNDFYYLANLLCGTFGVLMSPNRQAGQKTFVSPRLRQAPRQLSYRGIDSIVLLHPALPALFLGQLRLAAFLAAAGQAAAIRKAIPEETVTAAILEADRAQCVSLLRKAAPWVLRSESGLWVFKRRGTGNASYQKLLTYLEGGGTAFTLFGKDLVQNWKLVQGAVDVYGPNHHDRGFNDFMSRKGSRKIASAEE